MPAADQQQLIDIDRRLEPRSDSGPVVDELCRSEFETAGFRLQSRRESLDHRTQVDTMGMLREFRERDSARIRAEEIALPTRSQPEIELFRDG